MVYATLVNQASQNNLKNCPKRGFNHVSTTPITPNRFPPSHRPPFPGDQAASSVNTAGKIPPGTNTSSSPFLAAIVGGCFTAMSSGRVRGFLSLFFLKILELDLCLMYELWFWAKFRELGNPRVSQSSRCVTMLVREVWYQCASRFQETEVFCSTSRAH